MRCTTNKSGTCRLFEENSEESCEEQIDSLINKLQSYFGIVLRSNVGNGKDMPNAILVTMFHVASSYDHNYHTDCPKTSHSWLTYKLTSAIYLPSVDSN